MTDDINLEKLLYRILLGYYYININDQKYKVIAPSLELKYNAEILYDNIIEENKYDKRWLTTKEIEMYLLTNGVWSQEQDKKIKDTQNQIDDTKVDIYLSFLNPNKKENLRKNLKLLQNILSQLITKKESFNHLSIEEHASSIKNEFIIMNTIYSMDNTLVFNNDKEINFIELQMFIKEILDHVVSPKQIRQLIKSDLWRSYSTISNLERDLLNINDDYKHLINFHNMYNNVKQHPECPSEDIINDDDALDGWYIHQNRKAEKEKKKNTILDKVGGKIKDNADHVFIFTRNEEEAQAIDDLNDYEQKKFKKEVAAYSEKNPGTKWEDLPPVKRQLQMQAQAEAQKLIKQQQR
jgi:hypothetical protein